MVNVIVIVYFFFYLCCFKLFFLEKIKIIFIPYIVNNKDYIYLIKNNEFKIFYFLNKKNEATYFDFLLFI